MQHLSARPGVSSNSRQEPTVILLAGLVLVEQKRGCGRSSGGHGGGLSFGPKEVLMVLGPWSRFISVRTD